MASKQKNDPKKSKAGDPSLLEIPVLNENAFYDSKAKIFFPNGRGNGGLSLCLECKKRMVWSTITCQKCFDRLHPDEY